MKKIAAICILAAAQAYAGTAWVNVAERKVNWYRHPQIVQVEGRTISLAPTLTPSSLAYLAAAGWTAVEYDCHPTDAVLDYDAVPPIRCMTPAELEAREAQRQADQAAAEAAATLPATFTHGIAVTNSAGHWVKFVPDGTNAVSETLAIQISHSPPDPQTAAQMEADAIEAHEAKKAANRAKIGEAKAKAAAANSVPALRAAVAKIIEALENE